MRWPLRRSSPECRKAHRVTTAPEADGERRVLSRLGRPPTRWEPGPALAIVVPARGKGRVGGKREPGKRRKPGAFAGGATHDAVPTIACGTPDVSGATVVTTLVCFLPLHTGLRMRRASGVPRALNSRAERSEFGRPRAVITTGVITRVREGSRDAPGECEILEALPSAYEKSILPAPFS
ncbi:hypothetical protein HNQ36_004188 [Afipia massiliensis]|uniref:Uncharacterized protein n=1 Tax=Afipia massiliensis TaxID=211460 RepID=A0A840NBY2_9BRAD|nr:hypothetical protein [Afipia massiliensis]